MRTIERWHKPGGEFSTEPGRPWSFFQSSTLGYSQGDKMPDTEQLKRKKGFTPVTVSALTLGIPLGLQRGQISRSKAVYLTAPGQQSKRMSPQGHLAGPTFQKNSTGGLTKLSRYSHRGHVRSNENNSYMCVYPIVAYILDYLPDDCYLRLRTRS